MAKRVVVVDAEHGVARAMRWCRYEHQSRRRAQRDEGEEQPPQYAPPQSDSVSAGHTPRNTPKMGCFMRKYSESQRAL
jgi:hypothetical protein